MRSGVGTPSTAVARTYIFGRALQKVWCSFDEVADASARLYIGTASCRKLAVELSCCSSMPNWCAAGNVAVSTALLTAGSWSQEASGFQAARMVRGAVAPVPVPRRPPGGTGSSISMRWIRNLLEPVFGVGETDSKVLYLGEKSRVHWAPVTV